MTTIDNCIDSIQSPQTTGQPIQDVIKRANVVLGYSGHSNSWETFEPFQQARPDLDRINRVIPVTLSCTRFGHCYDIEPGGGSNSNIGIFMHNARNAWKTPERWGLPWLYTFASNMSAMTAAARSFGYEQGRDYYTLSAHPNTRFGSHLCRPDLCGFPRTDGCQHLFAGSYDESVLSDYMLHAQKPPNPLEIFPTDIGDKSFPNKGNERLTVEQAIGALKHESKYRNYLKGMLRSEIKEYRDRCWKIAKNQPPTYKKPRKHPIWNDERHFGKRWQKLNDIIKRIDKIK